MGKIKDFWKEHKREIITGGVATVVGGVIGGYVGRFSAVRGDGYNLLLNLNSFGTDNNGLNLVPKLLKFQEGTNYAAAFGCTNETHRPMPLSKFGDAAKLMIRSDTMSSMDLDKTLVRGGVLFMNTVDK